MSLFCCDFIVHPGILLIKSEITLEFHLHLLERYWKALIYIITSDSQTDKTTNGFQRYIVKTAYVTNVSNA